MSTRSVRLALVLVFGAMLTAFGAAALAAKPLPGYGRCHAHRCSCFGYQGSGYTCTRGGCSHHYDLHY